MRSKPNCLNTLQAAGFETTIELNGKALLDMLAKEGFSIPDNATVFFTVPSGGDWSGTDCPVDDGSPIRVTWKEVQETAE